MKGRTNLVIVVITLFVYKEVSIGRKPKDERTVMEILSFFF